MEQRRVCELYRQQGLRLTITRMGEESGVYHLWQLLAAHQLKVFRTLTGFLSAYRVGDEGALPLQCCRALLVPGQHCNLTRPVPQPLRPLPEAYRGPNSWML